MNQGCTAGSERNPPSAGPIKRLAPNAAPMSPKLFARERSSLRSAMADWVTARLPEKTPMMMRLRNASGRLGS